MSLPLQDSAARLAAIVASSAWDLRSRKIWRNCTAARSRRPAKGKGRARHFWWRFRWGGSRPRTERRRGRRSVLRV